MCLLAVPNKNTPGPGLQMPACQNLWELACLTERSYESAAARLETVAAVWLRAHRGACNNFSRWCAEVSQTTSSLSCSFFGCCCIAQDLPLPCVHKHTFRSTCAPWGKPLIVHSNPPPNKSHGNTDVVHSCIVSPAGSQEAVSVCYRHKRLIVHTQQQLA